MADRWIQRATSHSHGQFRAKAQKAGKSTASYADAVLAHPDQYDSHTVHQARLAKTLMGMHH